MTRRSIGLAVACWWLVVALGSLGVGVRDTALTPGVVIMALLLTIAPTALAVPAGRRLAMPFWALETSVSWATLSILLILVDPLALGTSIALLLLLPPRLGALAAPALLIAAAFAPARATELRRRGYCWAALPTGLLLLRGLDAFEPLTVVICCALALLVALLRWSIGRQGAVPASPVEQESSVPLPPAVTPATPRVATFPPVVVVGTRGRLS